MQPPSHVIPLPGNKTHHYIYICNRLLNHHWSLKLVGESRALFKGGDGIADLALLMMFGFDNHPYKIVKLDGGFKYFLCSPRKLGKIPILTHIFQMG